jgi:hypothetical protein
VGLQQLRRLDKVLVLGLRAELDVHSQLQADLFALP